MFAYEEQKEKIVDLILGGFKIIQSKDLYRFNIDSVLLAHFATVKQGDTVVDLGAGDGVLGLILLARQSDITVTGIEINKKVVDMLQRTIVLNALQGRYNVVCTDVKKVAAVSVGLEICGEKVVDLVICNPPYWKKGTGKISQNNDIAQARHEVCAELKDFVVTGAHVLKNGGIMVMCILSERLPELLSVWHGCGITPTRLRTVHAKYGETANIVLLEGVKSKEKHANGKLKIMPPLFIYKNDSGEYSDEIKEYYKSFLD